MPSRTVRLMSLTACTPPKLLEIPVTVSLTGSSATPCSAADTLTSPCPREPGSRRRLTRHHRQAFNFALSKRVSSSTATHHVWRRRKVTRCVMKIVQKPTLCLLKLAQHLFRPTSRRRSSSKTRREDQRQQEDTGPHHKGWNIRIGLVVDHPADQWPTRPDKADQGQDQPHHRSNGFQTE